MSHRKENHKNKSRQSRGWLDRLVIFLSEWMGKCIDNLPGKMIPESLYLWRERKVLFQMGVLQNSDEGCEESHITNEYLKNPSAFQTHSILDKYLPDVSVFRQSLQQARILNRRRSEAQIDNNEKK